MSTWSAARRSSVRSPAPGTFFAKQRLQLGRVQIWAVGRQIEQLGIGRSYGQPDGEIFITAEVVHYHDVAYSATPAPGTARPKRGSLRRQSDHIEHAWSGEAATAQAGDEGEGVARPVRDLSRSVADAEDSDHARRDETARMLMRPRRRIRPAPVVMATSPCQLP